MRKKNTLSLFHAGKRERGRGRRRGKKKPKRDKLVLSSFS
ncbi:hypothetical protein CSUI_011132 [Cystoisospora suis]|uniref:Uncharacterized protein n=1 Tax=Cystoisospora suis TaxID=483139 RepID=A0A2C6KEY7_9APIC|nr:hypothetical protein CSUI_011132 [Cystoisospora suis]